MIRAQLLEEEGWKSGRARWKGLKPLTEISTCGLGEDYLRSSTAYGLVNAETSRA
jgi:hypothetical protein